MEGEEDSTLLVWLLPVIIVPVLCCLVAGVYYQLKYRKQGAAKMRQFSMNESQEYQVMEDMEIMEGSPTKTMHTVPWTVEPKHLGTQAAQISGGGEIPAVL